MTFTIEPIAYVHDGRSEAEDDFWGGTTCRIKLADGYDADSLAGLADFSHLEVVYVFDRVAPTSVETTARQPRNRESYLRIGTDEAGRPIELVALVFDQQRTLIIHAMPARKSTLKATERKPR